MFKTKQNTTPAIFQQKFKTINHKYRTKFSANNLLIPNQKLKSSRFSISARGPTIWNKFCDDGTKNITSLPIFQNTTKNKLLNNLLLSTNYIHHITKLYAKTTANK